MTEFLVDNFTKYAHSYVQILIWLYMVGASLLHIYWLKPFSLRRHAPYVVAAIYFASYAVTNISDSTKDIDRWIALGIIVVSTVVFWLLDGKRNPVQKIFLAVIFRLISWLTMEIMTEIGFYETLLFESHEGLKSSVGAVIAEFAIWNPLEYMLALLLLYITMRMLHKTYTHKSDELTWTELIMLITPTCTLLLVRPIMSSYIRLWMDGISNGSIRENIRPNIYRLMFSVFSLLSVLIIIMLYQRLKDMQEEEYTRHSLAKQLNDTHGHVEHIEELYDKMRTLRHDLANHLTVIEGLAAGGKTDELAAYIGELQNSFDALSPAVKTGNAVTDVVLSEMSDRCGRNNIGFSCDFKYPDRLDINPFDMSVVLTNALQNAIEASGSVKDPCISVRSVIRDNVFILNVRNKMQQRLRANEEGLFDTIKEGAGHGLGLKSIRVMARKYNGDIEIRQEALNGELFFVLNVMFTGSGRSQP